MRCQLVASSCTHRLRKNTTHLYELGARLQRALPTGRAALRVGPCAVQAGGRARMAAVQVLCREAVTPVSFLQCKQSLQASAHCVGTATQN